MAELDGLPVVGGSWQGSLASEKGHQGRVSEAPPMPTERMEGTRGVDGHAALLPTVGYENPGATTNLRGVEANTGRQDAPGNSYPAPMQDGTLGAMDESFMGADPHGEV